MAKARQKSSKSARKKRAARARAARAARHRVGAERETQRLLDELFADEVPVARSAELFLQRLDGGSVPAGVARFFRLASSDERARVVAAEVWRLMPDSLTALTFSADIACQIDGDMRSASGLLDRALALAEGDEQRTMLARHLLEVGRAADALAIAEEILPELPADEDAQAIRAQALALAHKRVATALDDRDADAPELCPCWSGRSWSECCRSAEQAALERFDDREQLYALRRAMSRFTAVSSAVGAQVEEHVAQWLAASSDDRLNGEDRGRYETNHESAGMEGVEGVEGVERMEGVDRMEGVERMATEHAWIIGGEEETEEEEETGAPFDPDAPLALMATDRRTAPSDALAARRWLLHHHYGLWQLADPTPAPGVWLTEILTGVRRYVAIPPEQLEQAARWTVLLGALVAIDGTWRTTGAVLSLRPSEAEAAGELAQEMTYMILSELSGRRLERERPARHDKPLGVLAAETEPAPPEVADLVSKVIGSGMPRLVGLVEELRDAAPRLTNTDSDPLCVVKATVRVPGAETAAQTLAAHPDVELDGDELVWWGRELDALERATSMAEVRAHLKQSGQSAELAEPDHPRRWLRGRIQLRDGAFEIEVNSKERLERFLDLLRDAGQEPSVHDKLVIDPAQDLPQLRLGSMLSFAGSQEANEAWLEHWPDQKLPALGGRTPRSAARRGADQPRLEALLREFEHDADLLCSRGLPAPDVSRMRAELEMPVETWA